MRRLIFGTLAMVAAAGAVSAPAGSAHARCPVGDSGITVNRAGDVAKFSRLTPMRGMNCASAQYVLNRWLRRSFARSYSRRLPRRFWDGYVTWHCGKRTALRWQCNEYDSGTAFRFTAYIVG